VTFGPVRIEREVRLEGGLRAGEASKAQCGAGTQRGEKFSAIKNGSTLRRRSMGAKFPLFSIFQQGVCMLDCDR
jgi:hypothetical protein